MSKSGNRFITVLREGSVFIEDGIRTIIMDKETGVQYLVWKSGYAGGITPLMNSEGNVSKIKYQIEM